ncbi:hypothetical protein TUBRATIS_21760 [Tubulinosema ratisbonensis]|uniref:Uncharacterized protein n=1 Tax=Tubulinosema ratisbonensis TaxID=291195 RepID=A0A437AJP1_9MICR|nr:hypothetical protein TUBRATIS_21760 [Tubulinosema ratisbonensis]
MLINFFLLFKFMNNTIVPQINTMQNNIDDDKTKQILPETGNLELEENFLKIGGFIKKYLNLANDALNSEKLSNFRYNIIEKITKVFTYYSLDLIGLRLFTEIEVILDTFRRRMNEFEKKYDKIHSKKVPLKEKYLKALNEIFKEDIDFELFQAWRMKMGDDFINKLDKKLENIKDTKVKEDLKRALVNTYNYGYSYITFIKDFMETYHNIRSSLVKIK